MFKGRREGRPDEAPIMLPKIPAAWRPHLKDELKKPYFQKLREFLEAEQKSFKIFPPEPEIFSALELTPYPKVKAVLLGQDPYHGEGQAHGLSFSVRPGVRVPPSLVNIFRELRDDLGAKVPDNGYLAPWAEQGVLLINAVLTVRKGQPNSHKGKGWEIFTDTIIGKVNEKADPVVFLLWGKYAQKKAELIDTKRHRVIACAHPSPYSADAGFFGCRPFSKTNTALRAAGLAEIDWQIPDL